MTLPSEVSTTIWGIPPQAWPYFQPCQGPQASRVQLDIYPGFIYLCWLSFTMLWSFVLNLKKEDYKHSSVKILFFRQMARNSSVPIPESICTIQTCRLLFGWAWQDSPILLTEEMKTSLIFFLPLPTLLVWGMHRDRFASWDAERAYLCSSMCSSLIPRKSQAHKVPLPPLCSPPKQSILQSWPETWTRKGFPHVSSADYTT